MEKLLFFAKPKLGLDAVGGSSASRIADTLAEVCEGLEVLSLYSFDTISSRNTIGKSAQPTISKSSYKKMHKNIGDPINSTHGIFTSETLEKNF